MQESLLEEYVSEDLPSTSEISIKTSMAGQTMKERKKSIMTRFIPGKSSGAEGKRTGFLRSEEVGIPGNMTSDRLTYQQQFVKQASKESTDSASDNWLPVLPDGPLGTFIDNLGPGQVVGRQVLASPLLGEIQIGIMAGRSGIDVEIIRAKNLVVKPGVRISPGTAYKAVYIQIIFWTNSYISAPYVKVYLMEGKVCVAKAKTNAVRKTTAPLFQQHLIFNDSPKRKMLQITVLGDYGRMERKTFMGIALIRLDDLRLGSEPVIGWYKLYHSSSLAGTGPVRKDSETSLLGSNTLP
ncbi:C2 domain protein [Dictyocaulus viviparus]|uniref:C2 domain protein n=1 Tax=Dictyocaulus viviparus TaxID=29172 RepID=A0A0D8XG58_DICVI|nr:C2 domain protein [Dictyocaulus viviparus]